MKKINILTLSIAIMLSFSVTQGLAQETETVQATGEVLEAISITGTDLEFGEIIPGVENDILPTDASAAQFDITGADGKEVQAEFTLPENLTGPESATLAITFGENSASHATASGDQGSSDTFDPAGNLTTELSEGGELFIWLGGTVEAGHTGQTPGSYSADITLDVIYTGN